MRSLLLLALVGLSLAGCVMLTISTKVRLYGIEHGQAVLAVVEPTAQVNAQAAHGPLPVIGNATQEYELKLPRAEGRVSAQELTLSRGPFPYQTHLQVTDGFVQIELAACKVEIRLQTRGTPSSFNGNYTLDEWNCRYAVRALNSRPKASKSDA